MIPQVSFKKLLISIDDNYEVIQESNFYYLFGVQEVNFHACIELDTEKVTLFAPKVTTVTRIFQSPPRKADVTKKYGMTTLYQHKMQKFVADLKPVCCVGILNRIQYVEHDISSYRNEYIKPENDSSSKASVLIQLSVPLSSL